MYKRTEALVLNNQRYSEADLIVTYLTKDFGILRAFAKSPRKIKSRFGSSLEPLTLARIALLGKEQKSLPRLIQSDIIKTHHDLRENIDIFIPLSECIRLTLALFPERHPEIDLYQVFLKTLDAFSNTPEPRKVLIYLKMKILVLAGHGPALSHCGRCGAQARKFYLSEGSVICDNCTAPAGPFIEVSEPLKGLYRFLSKGEPVVLNRIKVSPQIWHDLEELIQAHINYNLKEATPAWQREDIKRTTPA